MGILGELRLRPCPVCGRGSEAATPFLDGSVDPARVDRFSFASRKVPEYMSFRLVRCQNCETVYAAEAPSAEALAGAYRDADYDSAAEAILAARTYATALAPHLRDADRQGTALEIGTGTGVFLRELRTLGFQDPIGIEPSRAAMAAAEADVRDLIREGVFQEADFAPGSLGLIGCFQTLEHVPDPRALTEAAFRLLAPGGMLAFVTHDYTSPVNRMLGRRSPIIDIEHMQIFNPRSVRYLVGGAGFEQVEVKPIRNHYPLRYWLRLAPLPKRIKGLAGAVLARLSLAEAEIGINVGNILTIGRKPGGASQP